MQLLSNLSDQEVIEFIKNIDSKKLCFLMMGLGEEDKVRIYSQISDAAKGMLAQDIAILDSATKGLP